jgi:hypothetical protein
MITVIGNIYKNVKNLLPHFLNHYSDWGVDKFCFGVYNGKLNPVWNEILDIGKGLNIELFKSGDEELNINIEEQFKNQIRLTLQPNDWFIPIDLDEFHTVEGYTNFQQLQQECESENAIYILSHLCDRITENGIIPMEINPNISIWEQFPKSCNITETIVQAWTQKICMAKQSVYISGGHHRVDDTCKQFSKQAITYHFKWFGPLYEKEQEKLFTYTNQKRPWVSEQLKLLEFLNEHNGRLL